MDTTPNSNHISLLVPDECWFSAPAHRTIRFRTIYSKVSRALHECMRDTLPAMLFRDLQRLENVEDGYPLLFYYASRPYRSQYEFCYDVLDEKNVAKLFRLAIPRFVEVLTEVWLKLKEAGLDDIAVYYRPSRAEDIIGSIRGKERFRRRLFQMLRSEARLLEELTLLGGLASCPAQVKARRTAEFVQQWNRILRRFYGGRDFTAAAPILLRAATIALVTEQRRRESLEDEFSLHAA